MATAPQASPLSVCLVALPESMPGTLLALFEVFSLVGVAWPAMTGAGTPRARFSVRLVAAEREPFRCPLGTPIEPHAAVAEVDRADIVIVTDLFVECDGDPRGRWPVMARWVAECHMAGAVVCSVCTGAVMLAEAGLLDDQMATCHWAAGDIFRRCYPKVRLMREHLLVVTGPGKRLVTAGGSAAWSELALYLIGRFAGQREAVQVAKLWALGDHSLGQRPFAIAERPRRHGDAIIARCQLWLADHYRRHDAVPAMVEASGLAERTFVRRFKAATGFAPVGYLQTLRIEEAKQLLETGGEPVEAVADAVGYGDPAFFRRLFKRSTGMTPARYRQRYQFRAKVN